MRDQHLVSLSLDTPSTRSTRRRPAFLLRSDLHDNNEAILRATAHPRANVANRRRILRSFHTTLAENALASYTERVVTSLCIKPLPCASFLQVPGAVPMRFHFSAEITFPIHAREHSFRRVK
ncbi:hypothetical protein DPSP01_001633 [Paraphaeosphaeria sporulosa]